jgi:hypothetical protein
MTKNIYKKLDNKFVIIEWIGILEYKIKVIIKLYKFKISFNM